MPPKKQSWFERLFGFPEFGSSGQDPAAVRQNIQCVEGNPTVLKSKVNDSEFVCGRFTTPSLAELRAEGQAAADGPGGGLLYGGLRTSHAFGDVGSLQAQHIHATFMVASQFNCLEFISPEVTPEMGVTMYVDDKTQGPACSIGAGPATVYRNYFCTVAGGEQQQGQSQQHQLNNLHDIDLKLGNRSEGRPSRHGKYYDIRAGYTIATDSGLKSLNQVLSKLCDSPGSTEELQGLLRVGSHADVQVTSSAWGYYQYRDPARIVNQIFTSACAVAYSGNDPKLWKPFAALVLEAAYEAVLWAAVLNKSRHPDQENSNVVFLTAVRLPLLCVCSDSALCVTARSWCVW